MFSSRPARWLATLAAVAAWPAVAQTDPPSPAHAQAEAQPALRFHSAFEGYRAFKDDKAIPWKEANDTVRARGGWRAHAEEAAGQPPPGDTGPAKAVDPHAGHAMPAHEGKKRQP